MCAAVGAVGGELLPGDAGVGTSEKYLSHPCGKFDVGSLLYIGSISAACVYEQPGERLRLAAL